MKSDNLYFSIIILLLACIIFALGVLIARTPQRSDFGRLEHSVQGNTDIISELMREIQFEPVE